MSDTWEPVHPDALTGDELALVMALFGDIHWDDQAAVEQRVADLRALAGEQQ
jgi:hypothetical protein